VDTDGADLQHITVPALSTRRLHCMFQKARFHLTRTSALIGDGRPPPDVEVVRHHGTVLWQNSAVVMNGRPLIFVVTVTASEDAAAIRVGTQLGRQGCTIGLRRGRKLCGKVLRHGVSVLRKRA